MSSEETELSGSDPLVSKKAGLTPSELSRGSDPHAVPILQNFSAGLTPMVLCRPKATIKEAADSTIETGITQ